MCRARTSSREIRLIASGCKNRLESGIVGQFIMVGRCRFKNLVDDGVGGNAFALGRETENQPVPQDRFGKGLKVTTKLKSRETLVELTAFFKDAFPAIIMTDCHAMMVHWCVSY